MEAKAEKPAGKAGEKTTPTINKIRVTLTGRNHVHLEKGSLSSIL
jgi:hypothetical protein